MMDYFTDVGVKILFIGDPHFKISNVEYIPLFITRIMDIINQQTLDFIMVAGDLLDNHDRIDVEPLNLAIQFIKSISKKQKVFILVGNHDYKNNQQFLTDHHWMNALKAWNNVEVVDHVIEYKIQKGDFEPKFLMVPYVPPGRFLEAIETKTFNIKDFKAIFAHQEFYGCKMGPIKSIHGDRWDTTWPLVVSGHIHNKQWSQSNIYYPGSAMQHAFGQSTNNTVTMLTFTSTKLDYEEIDLQMPKLSIKYLTINDVMVPLKFKNKEFRKYKIVLQGNQEEFQVFKKSKRYNELLKEGFKISFKLGNIMVQPTSKEKTNFMAILNQKIKDENDPELVAIFKKFLS